MKTRFADEDLSGTVLAVPPPCGFPCRISDEDMSAADHIPVFPPCRISDEELTPALSARPQCGQCFYGPAMDEELSLTLSPRPCAPCFAPTMDEELFPRPGSFCRIGDEELSATDDMPPPCMYCGR